MSDVNFNRPAPEIEEEMTTKEAIDHLANEINNDPDYRTTWRSNIAVCFQDAFHELHRTEGVHKISNEAAERFLRILCRVSEAEE